ncbi:hypothetical protein ACVJGD_005552 [Bradyrhizobium sp. USDA 10063]
MPITRRIRTSCQTYDGSCGRHDNYGFALPAQPGESQRRPATNSSSRLIVCIGLPALRAPGASVPMVAPYATMKNTAAERWHREISYWLPRDRTTARRVQAADQDANRAASADTAAMLFWALLASGSARSVAGRRSPPNPSISQLTSQPDPVPSCYSEIAPTRIPTTLQDGTPPTLLILSWRLVPSAFSMQRIRARLAILKSSMGSSQSNCKCENRRQSFQ